MMETFHGTTILSVRRDGAVSLGGDGQVTLGQVVIKASARKVRRLYHEKVLAGFAGATASFCWFFAMTLQHAALVKVVGQVEMIFTIASSAFIFKEHINTREIAGCAAIVTGIVVLLLT